MGRKSKKQKEAEEAAAAAVANGEPEAGGQPSGTEPADPDALTDEEFERYLADQKAQYESDARAKRGKQAQPTESPPPPPPVAQPAPQAVQPPPPVAQPAPQAVQPAPQVAQPAPQVTPPAPQAVQPPAPPPPVAQAAPPPPMTPPAAPAAPPTAVPQAAPPPPPAPPVTPPQPQAPAPVPPTPNTPVPQPVVNPNPGFHAEAPPHPAMPPAPTPVRTPSQTPPQSPLVRIEIPDVFLSPLHPSDLNTEKLTIQEYPLIASGDSAMAAMQFNLAGGFGFSEFQLPQIKVPSGGQPVWSIPGPSGPYGAPSFAGVILYTKDQRSFWSQNYDDTGGGTPPDCTSSDGKWGYGNPGGPCAQCPYSQWGSMAQINPRHKDSNGQACRHSTIVFLAMPGMLLPTMLTAPPTSLQLFKRYLFSLAQFGYPYFGVETVFGIHVTKIGGFNVSQINPGKHRVLEIEQRKSVWNATQALMSVFSSITLTRGEMDAS